VATIDQRPGPDGKLVYRVRVRRQGIPTQTATFTKLADAQRWAQVTKARVFEGRHFPSTKASRHTVSEMIERYSHEILPYKSVNTQDNQRYQLQWWHKQLGSYVLRDLTPALIAQCRDRLAETRSPASVRPDLAVFSHALTVAVKEWSWLGRVSAFGLLPSHLEQILAIPFGAFPSGFDASLMLGFTLEEMEGDMQ
jgi:hypothetical protein